MRVVRPWHRLPREAVDAPSMEGFKTRLVGALSHRIKWFTRSYSIDKPSPCRGDLDRSQVVEGNWILHLLFLLKCLIYPPHS